MKRVKLIAARLEAGYATQRSFVLALNKSGYSISIDTYSNIESGRKKDVDLSDAIAIARQLNKESAMEEIFLPVSTYKIRDNETSLNNAG